MHKKSAMLTQSLLWQRLSQEIHTAAMPVKHGISSVKSVTRPSNREGYKDGLGGSGPSCFIFVRGRYPARDPGSLEVSPHEADQIFSQFFGRLCAATRVGNMQTDMILQDLGHQAVNASANSSEQHQNIGALIAFSDRALNGIHLAGKPFNP